VSESAFQPNKGEVEPVWRVECYNSGQPKCYGGRVVLTRYKVTAQNILRKSGWSLKNTPTGAHWFCPHCRKQFGKTK
jgi:hypothetical protein